MLNRIRATLAGEPASDSQPSRPGADGPKWNSQRPNPKDPRAAALQQQQRQSAGFLSPFFSNAQSNGSEGRPARAPDSSAPQRSPIFGGAPSPTQHQERSFFGSLLAQAPPEKPSPSASPQTIRSQASALLKLATPPLSDRDGRRRAGSEEDPDASKRDSLEHQVHRRDAYISRLKHDLQRMQAQLAQYQKDHATLRRQQLESTHRHGIAVKLWRRTNDGLRARVECFEGETTPAAAREIANLIRDAAPPNKDSAYLMMLQDQLAKATVKLDHLGSQTEIVLHKGEEVVESLREEMNEVIRERCRMELELLDQERMLEEDMRRMVLRTERRLKRVQGEIDFLEKNAVEELKNQEDDESGSEDGDSQEGGEKTKEDDGGIIAKENGGEKAAEDKKETVENGEEEGDGDESSDGSGSSDDSGDEGSQGEKPSGDKKGKPEKEPEPTPEVLRKELRRIAMDRDRSLAVLQKKLREKNEEYHSLVRLREGRERAVQKLEAEKQDREAWARSKGDEFLLP